MMKNSNIRKEEVLLRDLSSLSIKEEGYAKPSNDVIEKFYVPCLENSNKYYRAVGYFGSTVFLIIGPEIVDFAKRGGKIKVICSPNLSQEDSEAIKKGYTTINKVIYKSIESDLDRLIDEADGNYNIKVLATLISCGYLEIKIAELDYPSGEQNLYHSKLGIFEDENNNICSFTGSSNETYAGWADDGNYESIEVKRSWCSEYEARATKRHKNEFNLLWRGKNDEIETINFLEAYSKKILKISEEDIAHIDKDKIRRRNKIQKKFSGEKLVVVSKKIDNLFKHQEEAIQNWAANDCAGLFKHATGSGKTVSALKIIHDHLKSDAPVLILVPSSLLFKQWQAEIKLEIDSPVLLFAGDGNTNWKDKLGDFVSAVTASNRIVLATMQTAADPLFINGMNKAKNLCLVVDEVHQVGSPKNSKVLSINAKKRLGLSATPERYNDDEGTKKILNYFKRIIDPIFTIYDALKSDPPRLAPYKYHPHILHLSPDEAEKWQEETKKIRKEIAKSNNSKSTFILSDRAKMLLIQRSRIAKKTESKLKLVDKVMKEFYKKDQKWIIYCEDQGQLESVKKIIQKANIDVISYHSNMQDDAEQVLSYFLKYPTVMVAINCLDEGVDIPSISHALILASTQNPRQFIQRRGRVLRLYENKHYAEIHDALVTPINIDDEPDQLSLVKSELKRAFEFSSFAINSDSGMEIKRLMIDLKIDINQDDSNDNYSEE